MTTALPRGLPRAGEVLVHRADARLSAEVAQRLKRGLSEPERLRADRFHFDRDRHCFLLGRSAVRALVGAALDVPPDEVPFVEGPHGKPELAPGTGLHFNVSHSGDRVLIGLALEPLGVDIERVRETTDLEGISRRFFSEREVQVLFRLPPEQRPDAFFRCWTRKEAFIKALGDGLSHPLDAFEVTLAPDEPARLLETRRDPEAARSWELRALPAPPGYHAALCARAPISSVRLLDWDPVMGLVAPGR